MLNVKSLTVALMVAGFGAASAHGKTVATIDGKTMTEEMFRDAVEKLGPQAEIVKGNPDVRSQFLNHLIDSQLLSIAAEKDKLQESQMFKDRLEEVKRDILAKMYLDNYLKDATSDKKLKEYFEKNKQEFSNEEVRASHILFKEEDKEKAEKILKEALKKDADFAALAKEHSTGPTGPNGGDLNFFGRGRMVPEFEKVAFEMKKGEVHPNLVKTQFGWHIIKVTDKKGGSDVKFEEKKEDIARAIERTSREDLLKSLREKAKVSIDENVLKEMKL